MQKDLNEADLGSLALKAWKAAPQENASLQKDACAGGVLKDADDVVRFIRDEGGSEEDVELAVKEMDAADGAGAMISATISTENPDRQNDTIALKGWNLSNYKTNPVILLNHASRSLPIGIATSTFRSRKENSLKQTILFNSKDLDPTGFQVGEFYKNGKMRAFSVGFRALEWEVNKDRSGEGPWDVAIDFTKQELLENSAVTIPANSDALADAKSMGTLPGFLKMAIEAIDQAGGWAFAPNSVKSAYEAIKELDDKRIFIDLGSEEKSFAPVADIIPLPEQHEEQPSAAAESDTKGVDNLDGGDSVQDDGFEIDNEDAKIIGEAVAELVDQKLSDLKEELGKSYTAATGRLD